ncbi:hypothetical protein ABB37_05404 [Leptomonas pyrrhocoris]|uniref:Abnormal spindle-like microcephaly-associated protein ASH domain-containing protein n=1 Tax=Leptomonas pyrrhocoris TaxID=157538 RepID=A0A0M9G094_LEPPY|nr:hypothetical protein ABB37_05404 [Leptomonas pyrrhocoris]KPA79603.1 hypothetical protein ABB37_05404 [Leptomonas pyrrhocoris]|eukprot:XP_015658042.1 hypothetical protein ABB37_05404 [Leptomonas pyrrhocoris]
MAESEEDNLNILTSWAPKAYQCFAAEFDELEQLKRQYEETASGTQHELEAQCRAEVDMQIQREYPDVYPLLSGISSTPWPVTATPTSPPLAPTSSAGGSSVKRQKGKQVQQQLQAEVAMVTARREALLHQHIQSAIVAQDRQPARQLAARYSSELATTQKHVKAFLEKEAHELQRFTSRPLASYALGEVLDAPPVPPKAVVAPTASAAVLATSSSLSNAKRSRAASISRAASERGSARSSRTKNSAARPAARSGKGGRAGTRSRTHSMAERKQEAAVETDEKGEQDTTTAAEIPAFLIDAHQFAVDYNEMLKKEYGYRPAMTNTFPCAADANKPTAASNDGEGNAHEAAGAAASASPVIGATKPSQQEKLRTHVPGKTTKRAVQSGAAAGEDDNGSWWLPPIHAASQQGFTADSAALRSARDAPAPKMKDVEAVEETNQRFAHSSPTLRRPEKPTGTTGSHNHHLRHDNHRTQRTDGAGAATKTPAAKMGTKGGGFASPVASLLDGIDCVAKEKGLRFSSYAGVLTRQVVRFVNRNAHRTRLRLKASAHPWFSYRCTRIAPAAGSVATTTADAVPPETPLNCGGFVEVEVIFCPQSIEASTAVVESVLEMGVAREINDRLSEGAQWQFLNISVHGQVVLPHFDWWRRSSTGGEKENALGSDSTANVLALSEEGAQNGAPGDSFESGTIVSHDHLLSCATPLYLGNGAAVEFGDVLVLSRTQQTLLLENTGSEAVVHLLSSSPEFAVSMAPEVATTLPSSLAVALQVTFCPLKEGLCEATLTVAVRASSDPASAVISESTVELHGIGVVPRVSITSLASQVVQERVLPQWQVNRTEAPLHTILRDTVPGVPSEVTVTVCNECAVPLAFHWEGDSDVPHSEDSSEEPTEAVKADSPVPAAVAAASTASTNVTTLAARSFMSPPCGTLAPFSTSTFVLTVTPATLQPLQTLYNLFLDDMPDPAAAESTEKLPFVDAEVVEFYRRSRLIPCTAQQQQDKAPSSIFDHNANLEDDPAHFDAQQVTYLDPVTAFSRFQRSAAENAGGVAARTPRGVFATSFLTYQQPSLPSLTITPAVIEERVECLLTCRHTRTVTMHNNAPVALHFILDPTEAEFTTSLQQPSFLSNLYGSCGAAPLLAPTATTFERWRGCFPASDGISAQCQPRKGTIPPHGSINITVHFTVEACGPHYAVVPCWVPAAEQLRAVLATAGPAVRTASASCRPSLPTHPGSGSKGQHPQPGPAGPPPTGRGRPISPVALQLTPEDASLGNYRLSERRQPSRLGSGSVGHTVTTVSRSPAEEALRVIEDGGCYAVSVTATGVGATVKASTDLLDFGLIELGQEAAASFTVSNPNSIPVVFDLCDPLMRHPPRFVFIPESFRLGAGNTVEVTVYRKAVSTEDAQTFFELTVRDGGASIAVETRATVQQPLLVVDAPVVQFGVVPENVWQTGTFHVSNRSAIDTEFTVTPATPLPPYIEVEYEKDVVLRAGEQLDVPVRCRFQAVRASLPPTSSTRRVSRDKKVDGDGAFASPHEALPSKHKQAADNCYSILLRLVSKRSRQTLLVEVRCDAVEKLSVSVDVATDGVQDGEAALPSTSAAAYIRAVLMNGLEAALLALDQNEAQATHADIAAVATAPPPATAAAIPYCDPVHLVDYMPDDLPLSRRTVHLVLQSYTGGEAAFTVAAQRYAPQSIENIGAQHILDKRASVNAAAAATTSKKDAKEAKGDDDDADNAFAAADCTSAFAEDETAVSPPAFWTTTVNGGATVQQAQRQIMEATQKVLGDGAGCVTLLSSAAGVLRSHGVVHIPVHLWCALPGRYVEHLCVQADPTLPLLRIPVEYEVYGKPIVLDATTSGLTKEGGRGGEDVLLMPPVIAPLGSSRRTIRLINRVSRDMDVTVEIFPCPLGMSVHAVDPDAPADKVELKLVTMTAEDKDREKSRIGQVTATPFKLCIPAHARREVVLEFTPAAVLTEGEATNDGAAASKRDARIKKTIPAAGHRRSDGRNESDSGSDEEAMLLPEEKWWHGSVCIDAVLAHTDSNDVFLVDEFYTIYADRYPSRRVARPMTSAPAGSGNSNSTALRQRRCGCCDRCARVRMTGWCGAAALFGPPRQNSAFLTASQPRRRRRCSWRRGAQKQQERQRAVARQRPAMTTTMTPTATR